MTALVMATPVRLHTGFWAVAFAFLTAMAFSTVPTPLYPLYMARDGFSTFTVTVVFAVYAAGVVVSLLLAGHVSDRIGRKRILLPALGLEVLAAVLFLTSTALPVLLAARFLTGLGVGMITATATAYLQELRADSFAVVSTAANSGGLGLGTLVAGFLGQFAYAPLRTPYVVFVVLLIVSIVAVALTPETVPPRATAYRYRPQRIAVPGDRPAYLAAAATAFASFAVFGVFTSLAPGFVAGTLHQSSRAVAGAVVFAVFGAAAAGQVATGGLRGPVRTALGLLAQGAGIVLLVAGMHVASLALFLIGGIAAGVGAGVSFKAALGSVAAGARPAERGAVLAGLFLIAYVGLGVPAVGLGLATQVWPAVSVMTWFAGVLVVVLGTVGWLSRAR